MSSKKTQSNQIHNNYASYEADVTAEATVLVQ
jgi:hypothetical protein